MGLRSALERADDDDRGGHGGVGGSSGAGGGGGGDDDDDGRAAATKSPRTAREVAALHEWCAQLARAPFIFCPPPSKVGNELSPLKIRCAQLETELHAVRRQGDGDGGLLLLDGSSGAHSDDDHHHTHHRHGADEREARRDDAR